MLFHSAIRKDLSRHFGATVVVLITIVMTIVLIRTLGQASRGTVNPSEVMLLMGLSVLSQLTLPPAPGAGPDAASLTRWRLEEYNATSAPEQALGADDA